jgi:hypothetical protein
MIIGFLYFMLVGSLLLLAAIHIKDIYKYLINKE